MYNCHLRIYHFYYNDKTFTIAWDFVHLEKKIVRAIFFFLSILYIINYSHKM